MIKIFSAVFKIITSDEEFLDGDVGTAYERTDSNYRFVPSQDFAFGEDLVTYLNLSSYF